MKNKYTIKAKLWRWPGDMGWHFVTVDRKIYNKIRTAYPKGFVKIEARIGSTKWNTSLFPHIETQSYLLSIKKSVRKKEEIVEGDVLDITFNILR